LNIIDVFLYVVLTIFTFKLVVHVVLSIGYRFKKTENESTGGWTISIVVPAYDEEITIAKCIESLLNLDYPEYDVIVVDDGSTDRTFEIAKRFETSKVRVIHQENQGKANALNNGILLSKGDIVVTVDADTEMRRDSLMMIARRFAFDHRLGAVAGNIKVNPAPGLMNALQATEYTVGINMIRKSQSMLGCVMIVPGPIAAIKREAVQQVGLFSDDSFAEDFDVTMKLLKVGYRVEYEENAIAYTDAPKNLEDFMKQRRRWYRGMIQVLAKHRGMFMNPKYGFVGFVSIPNLWFETVSPIINLALILLAFLSGFYMGGSSITLVGLITYLGLDTAVGIFALSLDPVKRLRDFLAVSLLSFYNIFLDGVRLMSFTEETSSIEMVWEKPRR